MAELELSGTLTGLILTVDKMVNHCEALCWPTSCKNDMENKAGKKHVHSPTSRTLPNPHNTEILCTNYHLIITKWKIPSQKTHYSANIFVQKGFATFELRLKNTSSSYYVLENLPYATISICFGEIYLKYKSIFEQNTYNFY